MSSSSSKVLILSALFSIIIFLSFDIITVSSNNQEDTTSLNFENINTPILSNVGVAIATSIGTDYYRNSSKNGGSSILNKYDEIIKIDDILENSQIIKDTMIKQNMIIVKEYLAFLKNDIVKNIASSNNKSKTLNTYISQLEYRYKNSVNSQKTLNSQRIYLESLLNSTNQKIENIKSKLNTDFKAYDHESVGYDVDDYLEQKIIYTNAFTYLIFTNKFLEQYAFLDNYNKKLLDTLILNKKAISTDSYVVIPDSGDELLGTFNLLYQEEEYKSDK